MPLNITYLLGAGASAPLMPVVSEITQEIKIYLSYAEEHKNDFLLENIPFDDKFHLFGTKREIQDNYFDSLRWIMKESSNYYSIDEFARSLQIGKQTEQKVSDFNKLRATLACFFMLLQADNRHKTNIDLRYQNFFMRLIDIKDPSKVKSNIKIITWNYDSLIDLVLLKLLDIPATKESLIEIQSFPLPEDGINFDMDKFGIVRLNGIADFEFYGNKSQRLLPLFRGQTSIQALEEIVRIHGMFTQKGGEHKPLFEYAWTNSPLTDQLKNYAIQIAENTNILVVIGYSFPEWNYEIDKSFLTKMSSVDEIIIQDTSDNIKNIESRFVGITDPLFKGRITLDSNVNKFIIPN